MAKELKEIPGWSQGVRDNAAIRMVKMIRPVCLHSQKEYEQTPEGRIIERRTPGQEPNCQTRGGAWWETCEALGHNPYYRKRVWYSKQDVFETDAATGEQVKTGDRVVRHEDEIPNIKQVPAHVRVNSGRGPQFRHDNRGYRYLPEMGFAEVCEMRNCQKPVKVESLYGKYCSSNHAALCGADALGTNLQYIHGEFEQGKEVDLRMRRNRELREAATAMQVRKL
jgi:hypothetical protein